MAAEHLARELRARLRLLLQAELSMRGAEEHADMRGERPARRSDRVGSGPAARRQLPDCRRSAAGRAVGLESVRPGGVHDDDDDVTLTRVGHEAEVTSETVNRPSRSAMPRTDGRAET